jgi:hypothetical protein
LSESTGVPGWAPVKKRTVYRPFLFLKTFSYPASNHAYLPSKHLRFVICKFMNYVFLMGLAALCFADSSGAQQRIYRCGNEYTNLVPTDPSRGCQLIDSGQPTVVPGTRPSAQAAQASVAQRAPLSSASAAPALAAVRTSSAEQKARDADARLILTSELQKAQNRQTELLRDYNNGEPEKMGGEARNPQKYLDRVAEMKASLARNARDMDSIRRELARMPAPSAALATAGAPAAK